MKTFFKRMLVGILFISTASLSAQEINSKKGYDTQIGVMVYMLENLKSDIITYTKRYNQMETDFHFDDKANSVGAIIMHLSAVEAAYQETSFGADVFNAYNEEEKKMLEMAINLDDSREILKEKPIRYYLDIYKKVRKKTLQEFKLRNDDWWTKDTHWAWFHVMEHQAHHLGQIKLISKRFPTQ
ncbi:mycothiol transferase [Lacinutrix sp. MEBiC02404]